MAIPNNNDANQSRDRSDSRDADGTDRMEDQALSRADEYNIPVNVDFLRICQWGESNNNTQTSHRQTAWERSLKAFHNEHAARSKYLGRLYRNRTKLFRPKTRGAIRKNLAAAASAMFSTADVVNVTAEHDTNPIKQASAAVWHEVVNYRLDRTSVRGGVPWFLISMGANLDAQLHGVVISKQFWDYASVMRERTVSRQTPILDQMGMPLVGMDGMPVLEISEETEEYEKPVRDRPMIELFPPENIILDETAPWYDPAQLGAFWIARHPMTLDAARTMMESTSSKNATEWLDVSDNVLRTAAGSYDTKGVRVARQGKGYDRYDNKAGAVSDQDIVWLHENFVRFAGEDYHFWSAGTVSYLSVIKPTEEAYPEQMGNRPYVYGYGQIESHTVYPMSSVESWQPLQQEANDIVNLQLDVLKQWAAPIAKVRQGRMFDWDSLQRRGAGGIDLLVKEGDDVTFERPPTVSPDTYLQSDRINADMDELSGTFAQGSVATNRAFNETVGGMRLLSASSNAVTEFDLRVWSETWVEPVIRQFVRLEQHYETDELIFSIAGDRAQLVERFGINQLTDDDLMHEASVAVNVGMGASDPMQRLQKLGVGFQTIGMVAPFFKKKIKVDAEETIKEIMGAVGYNDGMRFFDMEGGDEPPPELMIELAKMELEQAKLQIERDMNTEDNDTRKLIEQMKGRISLIDTLLNRAFDMRETQMADYTNRAANLARGVVDLYKTNTTTAAATQRDRERNQATQMRDRERNQTQMAMRAQQNQARQGQNR